METRRSNAVRGLVNFPVGQPDWINSGEGGMYVVLVVIPPDEYENKPVLCCGGFDIGMIYCESLISDNQEEHFPRINSPNLSVEDCLSVPYMAAIQLGSTGWSGWNEATHEYFKATFDDLTPEGKALWGMLEKMYPECKLELLTWLDT